MHTLMQNSMCDLRKFTRPLHYKITNNDSIVKTFYIGIDDSRNLKEANKHGSNVTNSQHKEYQNFSHSSLTTFLKERILIHLTDWKWSISYHIDYYKSSVKKTKLYKNSKKQCCEQIKTFFSHMRRKYFKCFLNSQLFMKKRLYVQTQYKT